MTLPPPAPPAPRPEWEHSPMIDGIPAITQAERERLYRERLERHGGGEYAGEKFGDVS